MEQIPRIILETERLIFREPIAADCDDFCAMEMHAEVRKYVGGYPRSREDAEKRFLSSLTPDKGDMRMWTTVLKSTRQYIGRCGLYPHFKDEVNTIPGEGALGFYIARPYWNQGYATEAGTAFIHFGFEIKKLDKIVTMVQMGNDASMRVLEKLGFVLERTEIGQYRSFYHMALGREEFYRHYI